MKNKINIILMLAISAVVFCNMANANMRQYIELPEQACSSLTYINKDTGATGNIYPSGGVYSIYDWGDNEDKSGGRLIRDFYCKTGSSPASFEIKSFSGQFEGVSSGYYEAQVWFSVDDVSQPCSLWQPAYNGAIFDAIMGVATSCVGFNHRKITNTNYYITAPINVPSNWKSIRYVFGEAGYPIPHKWYNLPINIYHVY